MDWASRSFFGYSSGYLADANVNILTGGQGGGIQLVRETGSPSDNESLGTFAWKGTDSANTNAAAEAMIEAIADGNHSGSAAGADMLFYTKPTSTGPGSAPTLALTLYSDQDALFAASVTATADVVAYSDKKLKKNIKTLDGSKVYDMRGVSFTRKDSGKDSSGVIAQEIQKIAPELISETDGTLGVSYGNITGYLIEAIKDLKAEVEELKQCNKCEDCNCKNE